jgi:transcriptional regulator with XRE-family HTH domain
MHYGEKIKTFRKEKNLTQEELGSMVGKKQNQISEWENGSIKPTPEDIINICKVLDISITNFFGIEDEFNPAVDFAKSKGLSPEEIIKAVEIYLIYKNRS